MIEDFKDSLQGGVKSFLEALGEDSTRSGLVKTPDRVYRAIAEILCGYEKRGEVESLVQTKFETTSANIVIVQDISVFSLCEHHLLPFYGKCSIGYIPKGEILGLSKFSRIVRILAGKLQVQENLTEEIATVLFEGLKCQGLIVAMSCTHLCCVGRGVRDVDVKFKTSSVRGDFSQVAREEFMGMLNY